MTHIAAAQRDGLVGDEHLRSTSAGHVSHQVVPGWTRFIFALRVFGAALMLGALALLIVSVFDPPWRVFTSPLRSGVWLIVVTVVALIAAGLSALVAMRLRRFSLFSQQLMFGALLAGAVLAPMLSVALVSNTVQCLQGQFCGPLYPDFIVAVYIYGMFVLFPAFVLGVLAYGIAAWSLTGVRARRVLWWVTTIVVLLALTVFMLVRGGVIPDPPSGVVSTPEVSPRPGPASPL